MAGVPYIYEKPLHMGLINQPDYFKAAMSKIESYAQNQIWLGKNLIIIYETTDTSLNIEWIEQIIEEYLL